MLLDKRYPTPRRHLRRLFVDPITGKTDWGLVNAPEGGIMGVYSLSEREPMKRANFEPEDGDFATALQAQQAFVAEKTLNPSPLVAASSTLQLTPMAATPYSYRDWKFIYRPAASGAARQATGPGG